MGEADLINRTLQQSHTFPEWRGGQQNTAPSLTGHDLQLP
jgi:hypothetical protein